MPEIAHTPALVASTVRLTGKPELALAETVYAGPLMLAPTGAAERKLIDWTLSEGAETVNDCCTCAAGWYVASPAWSASIVQVPAPRSDTEEPLIEQVRAAWGTVKSTGPHHSGSYHPIWAHCPGLLVALPSTPADAKGLFKTALWANDDKRPTVLKGRVVAVGIPGVSAIAPGGTFLPGGPMFDSVALRLAFTSLIALTAAAASGLVISSVAIAGSSGPMLRATTCRPHAW